VRRLELQLRRRDDLSHEPWRSRRLSRHASKSPEARSEALLESDAHDRGALAAVGSQHLHRADAAQPDARAHAPESRSPGVARAPSADRREARRAQEAGAGARIARRPAGRHQALRMKLAFVVQRYGLEIAGGAEYHCRLIAELLKDHADVEV